MTTRLMMITTILLSFGAMMLFMSLTYIRDVETLRELPGTVWRFVCGVPDPEGRALPLLVTIGVAALVGGLGTLATGTIRHRYTHR